jgi:hypothetical protein
MICHEHDCATQIADLHRRAQQAEHGSALARQTIDRLLTRLRRLAAEHAEATTTAAALGLPLPAPLCHCLTVCECSAASGVVTTDEHQCARCGAIQIAGACPTCSPEGAAFLAFLERNAAAVAQMPRWQREAFTLVSDAPPEVASIRAAVAASEPRTIAWPPTSPASPTEDDRAEGRPATPDAGSDHGAGTAGAVRLSPGPRAANGHVATDRALAWWRMLETVS